MLIQNIPKFYFRNRNLNESDVSLATGYSGLFLLLCHAVDNGDIELTESAWLKLADVTMKGNSNINSPSLLSGPLGIPLVLQMRFSANLVKPPVDIVNRWLLAVTKHPGRHELVSGASGIGVLAAVFQQWDIVSRVVDYLLTTSVETKLGKAWKNPKKYSQLLVQTKPKCNQLNLGIAHGILGPMLFLTRPDVMKNSNIHTKKIHPLLETLDRILLNYRYTSLPAYLPQDKVSKSVPPPSGWCYGDLSAGYAAVKIGTRLGIQSFVKLGSEMAIRGLRRNHKDTPTQELNLCHGHGSAVLIADRLFRLTEDERFQALHSYWKEESRQTLKSLTPKYLSETYRGYNRGLLYSPMGMYVTLCESSKMRKKKWDQFLMTEVD